jgi:hypothetical protein
MQPVDRYLNNLAKLLPADQREDILRELSEDIRSEIEDKESSLGRPLTEAEQFALLKRRGNPLQVAAGYTSNKGVLAFGPQWIGPVLFPFYVRVLTFNLGLTFIIVGAIFAAISLSGQPISFAGIFSSVILQLFIQLTAVTVIFALVEKYLSHQRYDLSKEEFEKTLHTVIEKSIQKEIYKKTHEVSRFDSIAVFIATAVALVWMQSIWTHPFLVFGPAASQIALAPVWHRIYIPTALILLATMFRAGINIAHPRWIRFRDVFSTILDFAGLAIFYALIFAGTWIVPASTAAANPNSQQLFAVINQWAFYGLWIAVAIHLAQTIKNLIRLYKNWRWASSPQG